MHGKRRREGVRECRAYFHIAASCGLSESNACTTIRRVEDALVKSGESAAAFPAGEGDFRIGGTPRQSNSGNL